VLFLGPPGTGKSHLAQALALSAIQQGHRVRYREAHVLLEELADATLERRRKEVMLDLATSSSTISGCASCRRQRPRISSS
jgi:DNA replication protein DnaC